MGLPNMHHQDMNLVLSTDAKPRLKWTPELHQRFVESVNQLGGADKATPKSLMRMMGIPGLTLYHLKSHLQKYRLGKNQRSETCCSGSKQDGSDSKDDNNLINELNLFCCQGNGVNDNHIITQEELKENIRVAQALQLQMEVQRKLHEQIEVQRHLQLRIEAQGKYLQKVLKKAQETLSSHNFSSDGVEHAKAELSQLVSMVSGSPFSELTELTDISLEKLDQNHTVRGAGCSVESSLTSSESSGMREQSETRSWGGKTRSRSTTREVGCVEQTGNNKRLKQEYSKETGQEMRKLGVFETFDLNSQCENDLDLEEKLPIDIDLNSKGAEQFNLHL